MVNKAKKTVKKTTKKNNNKKCLISTKAAIIVMIAAVVILAAVLIFVMVFKDKKYDLTCIFDDDSGTTIQTVYSYNFSTRKPYNLYQLNEFTAVSEEEAAENAELLKANTDEDIHTTAKSWSDGNKFYVETNSDRDQLKAIAESDQSVIKSLNEAKKEMEEYGFVCEVTE